MGWTWRPENGRAAAPRLRPGSRCAAVLLLLLLRGRTCPWHPGRLASAHLHLLQVDCYPVGPVGGVVVERLGLPQVALQDGLSGPQVRHVGVYRILKRFSRH